MHAVRPGRCQRSTVLRRCVLDRDDADDRIGGRQEVAQLMVFQGQLVDHPDQPLNVGAELFEFGFVLLAEFLEPYDVFAEPGLGVGGLPALFDLGVELVRAVRAQRPAPLGTGLPTRPADRRPAQGPGGPATAPWKGAAHPLDTTTNTGPGSTDGGTTSPLCSSRWPPTCRERRRQRMDGRPHPRRRRLRRRPTRHWRGDVWRPCTRSPPTAARVRQAPLPAASRRLLRMATGQGPVPSPSAAVAAVRNKVRPQAAHAAAGQPRAGTHPRRRAGRPRPDRRRPMGGSSQAS